MKCHYYQQKKCLSCQWIETPYDDQLLEKQDKLVKQLDIFKPKYVYAPIASIDSGFRNKAKMAVLGTVERPVLGIMTNNEPIDLCDCPLYSHEMRYVLFQVKKFIKKLQLVPYNINKKKGEIKFVILTEAQHQFMLRIVLRSKKEYDKIKAAVVYIQSKVPQLSVISINIQSEHSAIFEGPDEYILTEQKRLPIKLNNIPLFIQKGSFFQTNTEVASQLYLTAKRWLEELDVQSIWDLFCGVGGFGLHCITPERTLIGIEVNYESIACAKLSADLIGYEKMDFQSLDATNFALNFSNNIPDIILVNPPRRGIGTALTNYLQRVSPKYILYSSCNLDSLTIDLKGLDHYQVNCIQLFDMFPHTEHMEVLVLLERIKNTICS